MAITTQSDSLQSVDADIPSNYSRLIARELGLSARELPRLLRKTDVDVTQLLKDESRLTATQQRVKPVYPLEFVSFIHGSFLLYKDIFSVTNIIHAS